MKNVRIIDPDSSNRSEVDGAEKVIDGDEDKGWETETYDNRPNFGNLKKGMGVWIDLGEPHTVKSVQAVLSATGASAQLLAGTTNPPSSSSGDKQLVASYKTAIGQPFEDHDGTTMTFNGFDADQKYQYLLFWITELPSDRERIQAGGAGDYGPGVVSRIRAPYALDAVMDGRAAAKDLELLRAHVAGDRDAFAELFHRHRDRLWAVALRTLGDREEAADALQDALLSAHRAAARFRGDSAVTTWLHRIVVNACLDRIRRRQAHPTVPLPDGNRADDSAPAGWSRRHRRRTTTPRWWSARRSPHCPLSSAPRWCWSTYRAIRSPRSPASSASPRAR